MLNQGKVLTIVSNIQANRRDWNNLIVSPTKYEVIVVQIRLESMTSLLLVQGCFHHVDVKQSLDTVLALNL